MSNPNKNAPARSRPEKKRNILKTCRNAIAGTFAGCAVVYGLCAYNQQDSKAVAAIPAPALPAPYLAKGAQNIPVPEPRNVCEDAAQMATKNNRALWLAMEIITRNETGAEPKPYSLMLNGLNVGESNRFCGKAGQYGRSCQFDSKQDAVAVAEGLLAIGYRNFDAGCFQVNLLWHGQKFKGDIFDPYENARVAVSILTDCIRDRKDFWNAIGCYHSPGNPQKAATYVARAKPFFNQILNQQIAQKD